MALDLLFSTRQASLCESFPWLSGFGNAPVGVDRDAVYDLRAMGAIGINVA
jgi:hypothetical protein